MLAAVSPVGVLLSGIFITAALIFIIWGGYKVTFGRIKKEKQKNADLWARVYSAEQALEDVAEHLSVSGNTYDDDVQNALKIVYKYQDNLAEEHRVRRELGG